MRNVIFHKHPSAPEDKPPVAPAPISAPDEPSAPAIVVSITSRTIWIAMGIVILAGAIVLLLMKALDAVILLFIAIIIAEGLRPVVNYMRRFRIPRAASILLIYLAVIGLLIGVGFLVIGPLVNQSASLYASAPSYINQLQHLATQAQQDAKANPALGQLLQSLEARAGDTLTGFVPTLLSVPVNIVNFLFNLLLVLTMSFFWLTSAHSLKPFVIGLFPERHQDRAQGLLAELSANIGGYTRGVVVNMLVIATLTSIALTILGVPYALLLGIIAGLFEVLPFIGPWISGAVAALVALATGGPLKVVEVIIAFEIIQVVEGNTLVPIVMSRAAKLNPLVVIVAVVIGGSVLGIGGAALAVPLAVVVQLLILRLLAPLARNASGTEAPETVEVATTTGANGATTTSPAAGDMPEPPAPARTSETPAISNVTPPAPTQTSIEQPV
ncbi:MAG TPA: AI-2E family transporter [Ktedonobacterales bacterium]|nr:AI-2E family transporter [Ktedonobacterales bacterium]